MKGLFKRLMGNSRFLKIARLLASRLANIPTHWDGRSSILEMKESGFKHWKQMEWIGFYFQFLCERFLQDIVDIPGPRYEKVEFDGFKEIPWDFKAHAINTTSHQVIVNDKEAVAWAIKKYGCIGVILALGQVEHNDERRTFQKWHEKLKGGKSRYEKQRIKRGAWSRLRKVRFNLKQISFLKIDEKALTKSGIFQQNFRNADGKPRRGKVLLNLEKLNKEVVYSIDFTE